jgi:diguanylate cyclase (GGDEF)-like protein
MRVSIPAAVNGLLACGFALSAIIALWSGRKTRAERDAAFAAERALKAQNRDFENAVNNMSQGLCMFNAAGEIVVCNRAYLRMYSLSPEVVKPGCTLRRLIEHRREVGLFSGDVDQYVATILETIAKGEVRSRIGSTADGRTINIVDQPIAGGGWLVTHEDISERRRAEEKIVYMAQHDALTDLFNRTQFVERIEYELARSRRWSQAFAILIIDLDHFKAVNDSLGHPVGDLLLRKVADRLRGATRESDTVARFGGDEFAILQTIEDDAMDEVIALATRILRELSAPFDIDGHQLNIGASIGVALAPNDGAEADQLMRNADLALYRAKADGRNDYRFFEMAMDVEARSRHALEADLRKALTKSEFEVFYQTVYSFETSRICGAEALVRWRHPERGMIRPDQFIPLAEELGLIIPIGEWVLRTACMEAAKWPADLKLAVNLSAAQFKRGNLVEAVRGALADSGLAAKRLELEITESVLVSQNAYNLALLRSLKELGVAIVLDDFGTGFSSLSYLRMFPFDTIKIDRSFVSDMSTREDCAAIVSAVTGLSRALGIRTTAEGVETREQFELLRAAGCTLAQGFMLSRPRPAAELDFSSLVPALKAAS